MLSGACQELATLTTQRFLTFQTRKEENIRGKYSQVGPASIYTSISSINPADTQDMNCTGLFLQSSRIENEVVSSSNNLRNIVAKKNNKHTINKPIITSSSNERSSRKKDSLNGKALLINENLSATEKYLSLSGNKGGGFDNANFLKSQKDNAKRNKGDNNNFGRPEIGIIRSPEEKSNRTFFNWRVILNENGHLVIKGTLESGKIARTKPILNRLTARSLESIFKQIYHLKGNIVDNRNELPEYVREKFYNGFPDDWEDVLEVWKLFISKGSNSNFHWPIEITDDDNDTNSKMSDVTFERTNEEDVPKFNESGTVVSTVQMPNVSNFQISFSNLCGNNSKDRTKIVNNVYAPNVMTKKTHNHKENQCQNENVNIRRLSLLQKDDKTRDMQEDKIDIIVNNLLHKDCPEEYIIKIIQMFDSLNDVYLYRVTSNDTSKKINNNGPYHGDNKSAFCGNKMQGNGVIGNSERRSCILECHDTLALNDCCNRCNIRDDAYEETPDISLRRSPKKDSEEFPKETYASVISERTLLPNERLSVKWRHEHGERREGTNYNFVNNSHVKSTKIIKRNRSIYRSNSITNRNIENDEMENDDSAHSPSLSRKGEMWYKERRKRDDVMCRVALFGARGKEDGLKNNRNYCENSIAEDEMKLSEFRRKRHLNMTENIEPSGKKARTINTFVDANHLNVIHRTSENGVNGTDNKMMPLKQKQNVTSTPLPIVKSHNLDINPNKDATNDKSCAVSINTKEQNKNMMDESTSFNDIITDVRLIIAEHKGHSKDHQIQRVHDIIHPENAKHPITIIDTDTPFLILNSTSSIKTRRSDYTSNDQRRPQLLSDWVPRVLFDFKSVPELTLVFEGKLLNEAGHVVHRKFTTERIRKRLSTNLIEDINREVYRLVGDLHDSKHVVPKELLRYCREGCPFNINEFCKMWKSYQKANARETVKRVGNEMIDILNVPTSSRGRRIFPPLSYWTGERVAFRDNEVVYTTGRSPRYSIDRLSANTSNKLQAKEKMCDRSNDLNISREKGASDDASEDENIVRVDVRAHRLQTDLQKQDSNNANAVSQSDERREQYGVRQQSPIKKENLMYTYYKSIPHADDILSDDQVSQL
ncbi:uncharacterized protein LOC124956908 isoform X2 [Vespa velutina]|uniref:uncharacterized protein LOC124956908 isoform X2 n=1 Tax=Vespa velutina TaxID=202808 RepID=UPI001FB3D2B7|nr:uncharacterized protein LOC124956908 isoform X2 [Vespa velutina]